MATRGVNKVILVGNLGQDPEVRFFPSGGAVANITVATSESWRDKQSGEQREKVEWHRVALHGKLAEIAGEYLRKGSQVYIEGKLQTRKWQSQQGQDQYTTEIVVQGYDGVMQMLGAAPAGANNNRQPQQQRQPSQQQTQGGWGQPQQPAQQQSQHRNQPSHTGGPQYDVPPQDFDDD